MATVSLINLNFTILKVDAITPTQEELSTEDAALPGEEEEEIEKSLDVIMKDESEAV